MAPNGRQLLNARPRAHTILSIVRYRRDFNYGFSVRKKKKDPGNAKLASVAGRRRIANYKTIFEKKATYLFFSTCWRILD